MGRIASQITSLTIVYSTVYTNADQRKHQSSASLAFVRGIHRGPVNSPHKWPVTRKMFPFDDVIMNLGFLCMMPVLPFARNWRVQISMAYFTKEANPGFNLNTISFTIGYTYSSSMSPMVFSFDEITLVTGLVGFITSKKMSTSIWRNYLSYPDSKIHGANMGPTCVLLAPGGPHVGPFNLAIRVALTKDSKLHCVRVLNERPY